MVDANILYAGTVWHRWPHAVLQHALRKDFQLVLCAQVIAEAGAALAEDFPASSGKFERLLAALKYELVKAPSPRLVARFAGLLPDPEDVPIGLAAIHAHHPHPLSDSPAPSNPRTP
jgi:hypothetical protein